MKNFKTRVHLVEPTKLLERVTVDNMRFLNSIGHDYVGGAYYIEPELYQEDKNYQFAKYATGSTSSETNIRDEVYKVVYAVNTELPVYGLVWQFNDTIVISSLPTTIALTAPDGQTQSWKVSSTGQEIIDNVKLDNIGTYTLTYTCYDRVDPNGQHPHTATYKIVVISGNSVAKKPYSITDVINRILNAGVGAWNGYYRLDPTLAERWSNIPAPEFEITGKTLYEALLMVGGYKDIQGIPRLGPTPGSEATGEDWKMNYITFRLLNEGTEWIPPSGCIDRQIVHAGESYCGGLESYVDNFVDNSKNGAVHIPYPMTVRTETTDLVIDDNYAIIKTEFPIYKVNKVTQYSVNNSNVPVGDITPYIFEKSEYDNLSSYTGQFPTAKQFAMYYIQGQPNIYGLTLKPEVATALGLAMKDGQSAAVQIARAKSGQNYASENGISAFAYSVDYTPMTSRRVRQFRPTDKYPNGNLLYYNQNANIVDSKNYGGRMKSELARIGNKVELETYRLKSLADIPKAGQTKDGKKITQVDWEIGTTTIKVTLHLVENYNRISEYIGINSMQRFYEVSEKQATDRACNFSYFAKAGDRIREGVSILTEEGVKAFRKTFFRYPYEDEEGDGISFVVATAYDKDGNQIQSPTVHAVSGNGFGNSMSFFFSFEDNYSAGGQAKQNGSARKVQVAVPYGDEYGEFYKLKMDFYKFNTKRKQGDFTYADQLNNGWCDLLPQVTADDFNENEAYMSYEAVIDKNSGERISVETQIHFQANDPNVIIGSALGSDNPLVSNKAKTPTFVCLPYKLQTMQESIPLDDMENYKVATLGTVVTTDGKTLLINGVRNTTSQAALSWACVNEDGNIIIGKNEKIGRFSKASDIYLNFNLSIN